MKSTVGVFFILILLVATMPNIEAVKQTEKQSGRAKNLEHKIDVLLILCKQVGFVGAYDYCLTKAYRIYNDRYYQFVDPTYQIILEGKMYDWLVARNS